jgi:hypothetical protein
MKNSLLGGLRASAVSSLLDRYKTTGKFAQAAKTFNYSNAKDTKM